LYLLKIGLGIGGLIGYAIQFAKYALLHLGCGFIGESYSEYMTIFFGILDDHLDIADS
jgi:hypothetical protein